MTTQLYNAEAVELMAASFPTRKDVALQLGMADSLFANIPGIRAYWNMSRIGASLMIDAIAGQDLTNVDTTFQCPQYVTGAIFNGTTAHLYRADEATQDVTAAETQIVDKGLTVGGWVYTLDNTLAHQTIVAKRDAANNVAFQLRISAGYPLLTATSDGTSFRNVTHTNQVTNNSLWHFVVGRQIPAPASTGILSIFLDGVWVTAGNQSIPTIYNSTAPISLGAYRTTTATTGHHLSGKLSFVFLAGSYVPDYWIWLIWQWTKGLFGR